MSHVIDPNVRSWIAVTEDHDFSIQNLPYGIVSTPASGPRVGSAIGDFVIDLAELHSAGIFARTTIADENVFATDSLNAFMNRGRTAWTEVRRTLAEVLAEDSPTLRDDKDLRRRAVLPADSVTMQLPVQIGDFTDFYSSKEHATNVGIMFRGKDNALMPNWVHLPVGYHGRASTVFVSGTNIHRPHGQTKADEAPAPTFGPSRLLDFELEMGFFVGKENQPGQPVGTAQAPEHIFGMVLVNDWSARDIQKWEYVPLGPFLGKSFATSISPWVVTLDALQPFRVSGPAQDPPVLPYLQVQEDWALDINLEAHLQASSMAEPLRITSTNFKFLYWNILQQLAHHTVNGTRMCVGDLCGSGTVSGPTENSRGSMLEICWRGTQPVTLPDGTERRFLADGDSLTIKGWCQGDGYRVGFGAVEGTVISS